MLLSQQEGAEVLQIERATVYKMLKSGEFPAFNVGRDWHLHRFQVEE
jgi:excisionase family DNA binding protein